MKILTGLIQFIQIIGICYLAITFAFDVDINGLLMLGICAVNLWMISHLIGNMKRMADANTALYRDFAKRLGWEDVVGELDEFKKERNV